MSDFPEPSTQQAEIEQHIEESVINSMVSNSSAAQRSFPGAVLLSPQARSNSSRILSPEPFNAAAGFGNPITSPGTNSSMALLSPPGSRYAFDPQDNLTAMSPLLTGPHNRPLSAQDFNHNSNDGFFNPSSRPVSAQGFNNIPERPLSSMEIDSMTFQNDVANLITWINTLNSNQHRTVIDNLLSTLPDEILNYTKSKLENFSFSNNRYVSSPTQGNIIYPSADQEPLTLDAVLNGGGSQHQQHQQQSQAFHKSQQPWSSASPAAVNIQRALSPNFTSTFDRSYSQDIGSNRPRSADPYSSKLFNRNNHHNTINNSIHGFTNDWDSNKTPLKSRSSRFELQAQENDFPSSQNLQHHQHQQLSQQKSPNNYENRAFDITNLAQQLTQTPIRMNDYNNANALKLSALSTINNRAQLDSNKKRIHPQQQQFSSDERGRSTTNNNGFNTVAGQRFFNTNDESDNMNRNSMSVPPPQRINYYENIAMSPTVNRVLNKQRSQSNKQNDPTQQHSDGLSRLASLNHATKNLSLNDEFSTPYKQQHQAKDQGTPRSPAINPKQITSVKLLTDIPAWLKILRLHKYTSALQDTPWKELIYLDDKKLEEKGVTAMGARGKLLKAFDIVKSSYEKGEIKE